MIKKKKQHQQELNEGHLKVVDENTETDWLVEDSITIEEIKTAIEQLPKKYKFVVMLYLIEGYDHQEIASILGITEVASRTQLSRGKAKLKTQLNYLQHGTGY